MDNLLGRNIDIVDKIFYDKINLKKASIVFHLSITTISTILKQNGFFEAYLFDKEKIRASKDYRGLIENRLERKLKNKETIHHINGKHNDNRNSNLCLFRDNSPHMRLHFFAKRHKLPISKFRFEQPWLFVGN